MPLDRSFPLMLPIEPIDHVRGPADATAQLVWYGDYECDYCGRAFPVIQQLLAEHGERFRLIYRHFPVASIHPHAAAAAQAAEAANAQGKFWAMHDLLFQNQDHLADADFSHYALRLGLEIYRFNSDLSSQRFAARIARDYQSGIDAGVTGTPTFFINGFRYRGQRSLESLAAALFGEKEAAST
jgi:NhaA family Na+:H+ antiporter